MKWKLCLLTTVVGCLYITLSATPAVADETKVTLQPGETRIFDLNPKLKIWNPNFWIHFHTSAHVHIRQHLHAWGHWTREELEWIHFHTYRVVPGPDSRVEIENIGKEPVQFDSVMNTTCVDGENAGEGCMTDADCPGSTCSAAVCRGGANDGVPCPEGDADCPEGTCDVNVVDLAPGEMVTTPMVGPVTPFPDPKVCPDCVPSIEFFWHWDWERTVTSAWLGLRYWSITDYHFAIDEWWHMSTESIATGVDGDFTGNYLIEITNNGDTNVTFTCKSNMFDPPVVPTISEWGVIAMVLLVLTVGTIGIRRRRRARIAG